MKTRAEVFHCSQINLQSLFFYFTSSMLLLFIAGIVIKDYIYDVYYVTNKHSETVKVYWPFQIKWKFVYNFISLLPILELFSPQKFRRNIKLLLRNIFLKCPHHNSFLKVERLSPYPHRISPKYHSLGIKCYNCKHFIRTGTELPLQSDSFIRWR